MRPDAKLATADVQECLALLETSLQGLSDAEAALRLAKVGPNALPKIEGPRVLRQVAAQFTHTMAILLWCTAIIAAVAGMLPLAWAIVSVNLINGAFSFWQEHRAQKTYIKGSRSRNRSKAAASTRGETEKAVSFLSGRRDIREPEPAWPTSAVMPDELEEFTFAYPCHGPCRECWFFGESCRFHGKRCRHGIAEDDDAAFGPHGR